MSVLTLTDAKTHLNITVATYDTELMSIIVAAEAVVSKRCGPLAPVASSCRVRGVRALMLPVAPVVSLTSVTPAGGTALVLSDLYLDTAAGVITYNTGGSFSGGSFGGGFSGGWSSGSWSSGVGSSGGGFFDVVFTAGRATVPDDLLYAVKELVRHLWSTSQRGGSRRPGSEAMAGNPATYLLPYQVQSLIEPYVQPGFA